MKEIKLSEKDSKKITENIRMSLGKKAVPKEIKAIKFHKDFNKGERLCLCLNCGYPGIFWGAPIIMCECKKPKIKIYNKSKLEDFILKLQAIHYKKEKVKFHVL